MSSASASRFSAVACATSLELRIELATCSRSRASGASTVSELTASCSSWSFWRARICEHLVGLLQRRVGAPDDLVEVLAAARHAGAELVEDQRQPLALGLAHRVADQVDVDRLHRVLDRQQVLALAGAVLDLAQLRRRLGVRGARLRGLALHEALADQVLRAHDAARVAAEVLVAGLGDLEHDRRLEVVGDLEIGDLADLDAGDLDVLAGDDEPGVVEDRAHLVAVLVLARDHEDDDDRHDDEQGERREDPHGPTGRWVGSQSRLPPASMYGAEPSGGCWLAEPGQRRSMPVCRPASRWETGSGTSVRRVAGHLGELEGVEDRLDARVVAVGVVVGGADAEVAEPADELRDVGPRELEHGLALLQRLGAALERRAGDLLEAGQLARGLDQVVVGAGPADRVGEVG